MMLLPLILFFSGLKFVYSFIHLLSRLSRNKPKSSRATRRVYWSQTADAMTAAGESLILYPAMCLGVLSSRVKEPRLGAKNCLDDSRCVWS